MRGETLYPLNALRSAHSDVYERERAKYAGREVLLELRIPLLDVLWNDAVHLAPIHPARLMAVWRAEGFSPALWRRTEFFRIPVERIDAGRAVWFGAGAMSSDVLRDDEVEPFDVERYRELEEPPPAHTAFLRERREQGRRVLPFAHVPHVLVAAPVDVAGVEVVRPL
jgi:hypothetical protein